MRAARSNVSAKSSCRIASSRASYPETAPGTVAALTPLARHGLHAERLREELGRPSGRRPAGGVQRVQLPLARDVDEREQVAADARVVLRRDVEHRGGRDGCVDGIASLAQDLDAGLRRQRDRSWRRCRAARAPPTGPAPASPGPGRRARRSPCFRAAARRPSAYRTRVGDCALPVAYQAPATSRTRPTATRREDPASRKRRTRHVVGTPCTSVKRSWPGLVRPYRGGATVRA